MTDYTKTTNFASKDALPSGNANKIVKGTEINTEFDNIATAVTTKANIANPAFTGVVSFPDGSASNPSITNTGDTNAGLFFSAADTLAFSAGGTAQVVFADGVISPVTDSDVDLGTNSLRFKDAYVDSVTVTGNGAITGDLDVDGTIEFDALSGTGSVAITDILDEDDMASNSATALATQQSIKAYVIAQQDTVDSLSEVLALGNTTGDTDISVTDDTKVQFRDSAIYINSSADGQLDIVADTEIQIAATTIDINGAVALNGAVTGATNVTLSGELDAATGDFSGAVDIDGALDVAGTTNLDVVDIDGAVDMASTLTVGSGLTVTNGSSVFNRTHSTTTSSLQVLNLKATSSGDMANGFGPSIIFAAADTGTTSNQVAEINAVRAGSDTVFNLELQTADATRMTIGSGGVDVTGVLTANAGVVVDNITIDGNEIDVSSGNLTLDVAGNIILDADGGDINLLDGGTQFGQLKNSSSDFVVKSNINNQDLIFQGVDGGSAITALTLDMSAAGAATFNSSVNVNADFKVHPNNTTRGLNITSTTTGTAGDTTIYDTIAAGFGRHVFKTDGTERFKIAQDGSLSTSTAGTSNVRFGVNAGNSIASGGNYNVLVGDEAGTAITTGDGNSLVGKDAGRLITTGQYNTTVGFDSLENTTTANDNTAMGYYSLQANTTGASNAAFGRQSLASNTTASNNTAVGYFSLAANTTGNDSAGFGFKALTVNTTGNDNTASGAYSLQRNTTGSSNVSMGYDALGSNTTASNNTAVGYESLQANTTASNNTAVGYQSLYANITGTENVGLGRYSLHNSSTGNNNTAVGTNALFAATTASNNTAVGRNALFANTTGTWNTAIGFEALKTNITTNNSTAVGYHALMTSVASDNTAFGTYALRLNTSGTANTALGQSALTANTTASQNTAVGYKALTATTTGAANTAVGFEALDANTTAANNVGIGWRALYTNTTGTGLVAVGTSALDANTTASNNVGIGLNAAGGTTTGANNVAIGTNSLLTNSTGASNVSIGTYALNATTTADNNTAVGHSALTANTTGYENTSIGKTAGSANTTGLRNTFVGAEAGNYSVATTTGDKNVIVGAYSHTSSEDENNANIFGYAITADGGYTTVGHGSNDIRAAHGNVTWATVSDQRYKKDIVDSTAGLSFINALQPRTFKYKNLGELPETFSAYEADSTEVFKNSDTNHGFIAQEVKAAIDADSSIKDGFRLWDDREDGSQEVAEAALIPVLTKAIQELSAQVEVLTARIETLEG